VRVSPKSRKRSHQRVDSSYSFLESTIKQLLPEAIPTLPPQDNGRKKPDHIDEIFCVVFSGNDDARKDRRAGQAAIADAHYSLICVAAYTRLVELLRVEQSGLELRVWLYIEIILIERVLAVRIKLNARGSGHLLLNKLNLKTPPNSMTNVSPQGASYWQR
jgi:hypothetical protein